MIAVNVDFTDATEPKWKMPFNKTICHCTLSTGLTILRSFHLNQIPSPGQIPHYAETIAGQMPQVGQREEIPYPPIPYTVYGHFATKSFCYINVILLQSCYTTSHFTTS